MAPDLSSHVHATTDVAPKSPSKPTKQDEINPASTDDVETAGGSPDAGDGDGVNYVARAQWLRAAVLGANDGLVTVASLMIGVGAVNEARSAMLATGLAGLVSGACSMAIGEFVSVYAQYDIEVAQIERAHDDEDEDGAKKDNLPSPTMAAGASALAFAAGAALPLLAGGFVRAWAGRVAAVCVATTVGLAGFGVLGAYLGGASVARSGARVLVGGWLAMATTYGVLRLFGMQSA